MTDHAKALADALRDASGLMSALAHADGWDKSSAAMKCKRRIDEALAAYDAHPAEAATRENGDMRNILGSLVDGEIDIPLAIDRIAALSTHQQQAAESELIDTIYAHVKTCRAEHQHFTANILERAADALSRAPQPDTVTEEMAHVAAVTLQQRMDSHVGQVWDNTDMRAALTAALAVRGK